MYFETSLVLVLAIVYSPVMEFSSVLCMCMRGRKRESTWWFTEKRRKVGFRTVRL